jgi:nucleotide-binding universal stress UspA family protein
MSNYSAAVRDFKEARRQAVIEEVLARLTGKQTKLLSFEEARKKLKVKDFGPKELRDIPLDAIVGSVGRYSDFTRSFLPRRDSAQERWARVMAATKSFSGVPPIEVYQVGEVYFVKDGNHRVSVARQLGSSHIEAYVTPVRTKAPLPADAKPEDLIVRAEYADFLERTNLDQLRPEANLEMTVAGQYDKLTEHIAVHRYFMGLEQDREVPFEEAVAHWYDILYKPVVEVIRERGVLRDFPGRTETDLYLWVLEHRAELVDKLGWELGAGSAAMDLVAQRAAPKGRRLARARRRILDALTPAELEAGPPAGQWRKAREAVVADDCLLGDILVAIADGTEPSWHALDAACAIARCEDARMHGLHVVPNHHDIDGAPARAIQAGFAKRSHAAGFQGTLAIEVGKTARVITERSRLMDLVVLTLRHPYRAEPLARVGSGLRFILSLAPTPVLTVPAPVEAFSRILLAYDQSPKAQEALFMTTYLAGQWEAPPVVMTVREHEEDDAVATLNHAKQYLERRGVEGVFVTASGPVASTILMTAEEHEADLIIMGGYGSSPLVEIALGSTVGDVLRSSRRPVLVCR